MLDISRSERRIILIALFIGLLYAGLSYYVKTTAEPETVHIDHSRFLININKANEFELERLPGIGPVLAGDIVAYRQSIGGFTDIEQLKNIKGIGGKKFKNIKELVTIDEKTY